MGSLFSKDSFNEKLNLRVETTDGSTPSLNELDAKLGEQFPLSAFQILRDGDVLDIKQKQKLYSKEATNAFEHSLTFSNQFMKPDLVEQLKLSGYQESHYRNIVKSDIIKCMQENISLIERCKHIKPIKIFIIPPHKRISQFKLGVPISRSTLGLFWNKKNWPEARILLEAHAIEKEPTLVVHEFSHALHYLFLTQEERSLIYKCLQQGCSAKNLMDEVFAVYSECEFQAATKNKDELKQLGGIYALARKFWSDKHVFTRFIRKLYFPNKEAAGYKMGNENWNKFLGSSSKGPPKI